MTLAPGTQIGPYSIAALIGTGGMGQVYRAHDPRLGRDVAIKVAAEAFSERFTREARAIAALNHTNVCHLYDVGPNYLVMECVEGESPRGPLTFEEALPILRQLIDGIEAAHEKGIVHRDLKPANVRITPDGVVKILDFGLAKALEEGAGSKEQDPAYGLSQSPTIAPSLSMGATVQGTILGTAAYMSPEQAKGRPADKRSDIWSFGVVAYELLTGQTLFQGETAVEILGAVLNQAPDLSAAPPRTHRLLRWCLERDRRDRLQAIGDARRLLAEEPVVAAQATGASSSLSRLGWAIAAVALLGLATMSWLHLSEMPSEQPLVHLSIPLPGNAPGFFALSPDGRLLVMSHQNGLGLRALDSSEVRPLAGTQGARTPFWSPDSRTIAFFADRKLKTVAATGGPPQTFCDDVGLGTGGTWNRDGTILFATEAGALNRVSDSGGACAELTKAEPGGRVGFPVFLPDGEHLLYVVDTSDEARRGLYVASLADPNGRRLLADRSSGVFVPDGPGSSRGRLLFIREQTLMAQPFDAASLQLSGDPVAVAEQISFTFTAPQIAASAGMNGTLVYLTNSRPDRQLVWFDRSGKETGQAAQIGQGFGVSLAPDGKHIAFVRSDGQSVTSLWLQDVERNQERRLTTPPLRPFGSYVWSPDGQRLAFRATGTGVDAIYVKGVNGGTEEILLQGTSPLSPSDWSRDGRWLVYTDNNPKTGADLWLLPNPSSASADRKPVQLLVTPFLESQGQISPDGKWLAYVSNESGREDVYVRPFGGASPGPDTAWRVATVQGSREPRWRADGKELFYLEFAGGRPRVMSVPIDAVPNPIGTPKPLFEFRAFNALAQSNTFLYSPSADGQRFLVNVYATEAQPSLEVLLNWGRTPLAR